MKNIKHTGMAYKILNNQGLLSMFDIEWGGGGGLRLMPQSVCVCVCVNKNNTAASVYAGYRLAMHVGLSRNMTIFDTQSNVHRLYFNFFSIYFYSFFLFILFYSFLFSFFLFISSLVLSFHVDCFLFGRISLGT